MLVDVAMTFIVIFGALNAINHVAYRQMRDIVLCLLIIVFSYKLAVRRLNSHNAY